MRLPTGIAMVQRMTSLQYITAICLTYVPMKALCWIGLLVPQELAHVLSVSRLDVQIVQDDSALR